MLKIINKKLVGLTIIPAVKMACIWVILLVCSSFNTAKHPFYLSVTDIKYNAKQKTVQMSTRLFTNDLEDALSKIHKKTVDLINPKHPADSDTILFNYIRQRLSIVLDSRSQPLHYVGYEREEESIWVYLEVKPVNLPKSIEVNTKLLYDFLPQQINIVHAEVNGKKKSSKVANPESKVELVF